MQAFGASRITTMAPTKFQLRHRWADSCMHILLTRCSCSYWHKLPPIPLSAVSLPLTRGLRNQSA